MCACALIDYIPITPQDYCKITLERKYLVERLFAYFVGVCLFNTPNVVFVFSDHQVTLKFTQMIS